MRVSEIENADIRHAAERFWRDGLLSEPFDEVELVYAFATAHALGMGRNALHVDDVERAIAALRIAGAIAPAAKYGVQATAETKSAGPTS